jgi:putative spermidine/putrescine transport system permease protein
VPEATTGGRTSWRAVGPTLLLLGPAFAISASLLAACLIILRYSFNAWSPTGGMLTTWTLENYVAFLTDSFHYAVLATTLRVSVVTTVLAILLGYPVAYLLSVSRRKHLILFLIILPLLMDVLVRAYGWVVLLNRNGLVNRALVSTGLLERPISFLGTETAVVLELLHEVLPFMVLPIASVLERIDPAIREAATGLGAGQATTFWRITLPLSAPGLLAGTLLTFSLAASAFVAPLVLGGGRVLMMSILIQQQMTALLNFPAGSAQAIVLILLVSLLLIGYGRALRARPAERFRGAS